MFVYHFRLRKRALAAGAAAIVLVIALAVLLPGCRGSDAAPIAAGTAEQRLAYLTGLGWAVDAEPVETLDLQLPERLEGEWADYAKLQSEQGLPFADCAGQPVRRYTYTVTNYPGIEKGVQANLFICGEQLIGGDIIVLGEGGFQTGLAFPKQEKT
ncbi:MAG: DUF4830 domain-containing protein [Ruminococcaceae bacterium]|nr:DUF4830 domain-containing protein [Oscillospiraceae bacterium]